MKEQGKQRESTEVMEVEGIKTAFIKEGHPSTSLVLFIHGWGGTKETWRPLLGAVAQNNFWAVALDLPGFGESQFPPKTWGVPEYSDFLASFINALGKETATLVARSFGARVAAAFAATHHRLIDRLILVSAAGIPGEGLKTKTKKLIAKMGKTAFSLPGVRTFRERAREALYKVFRIQEFIEAGEKRDVFIATAGFDLRPLLPKVRVPTLIIWGEEDKITPLKDAYVIKSLIPNSNLAVLPGAGHQVQEEQRGDFLVEALAFLTKDNNRSQA